jgi:2-keto-3-deoxy-L-rhamnonate aldolase RhmA
MESQEAANNIVEIAVVEGIDCIQMGPLDLRFDTGLL